MKKIAFIILLAVSFFGCSQGNKSKKEADTPVSNLDNLRNAIIAVRPEIHDSYSAAAFLELTGADYMPNLVNDPQMVSKYENDIYLAAVNLGIYNLDVLYQAGYKEPGALLSYAAAKTLAYKIGIGEIYEELFLDRLEEGIQKEDSIFYKFSNVLSKSQSTLTDKDEARLFVAMIIGANVEEMYILNHIIFNYNVEIPDESKLLVLREVIMVLAQQIKEFEVLTAVLTDYKPQSEKGEEVLKLMNEVIATYKDVNLADDLDNLKAEQVFENQLLITGFDQIKTLRAMLILE